MLRTTESRKPNPFRGKGAVFKPATVHGFRNGTDKLPEPCEGGEFNDGPVEAQALEKLSRWVF